MYIVWTIIYYWFLGKPFKCLCCSFDKQFCYFFNNNSFVMFVYVAFAFSINFFVSHDHVCFLDLHTIHTPPSECNFLNLFALKDGLFKNCTSLMYIWQQPQQRRQRQLRHSLTAQLHECRLQNVIQHKIFFNLRFVMQSMLLLLLIFCNVWDAPQFKGIICNYGCSYELFT